MPLKPKKGYLLIETLLALLILASICIHWVNFLRTLSPRKQAQEITLFFSTKKLFLQALDEDIPAKVLNGSIEYRIQKFPLKEGLRQLQVDCFIQGRLRYSIVGVVR